MFPEGRISGGARGGGRFGTGFTVKLAREALSISAEALDGYDND